MGPGQTLDGRFLLREEIGRGGMATIFKAEDLENRGEPVVVKVPMAIFSSGVGAWSMFQREEEIGLRLDHPYVLKFVRLPADKRRSYMVTEYVPGQPLSKRLFPATGVYPDLPAASSSTPIGRLPILPNPVHAANPRRLHRA